MTRRLPKSLHTITVLENVARYFIDAYGYQPRTAMALAIGVLKLEALDDEYGLTAAAFAKIKGTK
jgi:hypothetical protein